MGDIHYTNFFGVVYCKYVQNHLGANVVVVFDGYPDSVEKKSTMERARSARVTTSAKVLFFESMQPQKKVFWK